MVAHRDPMCHLWAPWGTRGPHMAQDFALPGGGTLEGGGADWPPSPQLANASFVQSPGLSLEVARGADLLLKILWVL